MDTATGVSGFGLDRMLFMFEPTGDGSDAAAPGDGAGGEPSLEPAADLLSAGESEAVPSAAATETPPAWSPDDPAFLDAVDERTAAQIAPLLPFLQQIAEANNNGNGGAPAFDWDQIDTLDPGFGNQIRTGFEGMLDEKLAPVMEFVRQMQEGQQTFQVQQREEAGNENIDATIAADFAANGELGEKAKGQIRPLAEQIYRSIAGRYATGPNDERGLARAADVALKQAIATVRDIVTEARPAVEDTTHLTAINGARTDIGGAGSGSGVITLPDVPLSNAERVAKYAQLRAVSAS